MEFPHARALSLLEQMVSLSDPKARRDITLSTGLATFANLYNCNSERWITLTPTTRQEHTNIFLCALDIVCAVLNINMSNILGEYAPNPQTIAYLSKETVGYSGSAAIIASKIQSARQRHSASEKYKDPYYTVGRYFPDGFFYRDPNEAFYAGYVNHRTAMMAVMPNEQVDVTQYVMPEVPGTTYSQISFGNYAMFSIQPGDFAFGSNNYTVLLSGSPINSGIKHTVSRRDTINIINNSQQRRLLLKFTVHHYHIARPNYDAYPTYRADLASTYSYISHQWHHIRSHVLRSMNLPPVCPPDQSPIEPVRILTIALLGRLADVYTTHSPEIEINMAIQPVLFGADMMNAMQGL
uniref:Core protein VP7 n=1 Tax=Mudumu virus TaxID=2841875 RepID=A0A8E8V2K9_9REOV|nr:inner capsid protein [Mudumu virus]